jgi:hypothetical protein
MTTSNDIGFDQHDLDHMDDAGSTVYIAYIVRDVRGNVLHATDFSVSGPTLAAALRPLASSITP